MKRTVLSFLGIMKEGDAHADVGWHSNTPRSHSLFNSLIVVSLHDFGTGDDLWWYGLVPSLNSKETGSVFQSPSVPQFLWVTPVTYFGLEDLGEYSWH
jgi:hypothetical protein